MVILVVAGTLFDIVHKKSAKYFFNEWKKSKNKETRHVAGREVASLLVRVAVVEGLMSGEFCNARRRIAHLLTMYGFVVYVITTVIMVFGYSTPATPVPLVLPLLWYIGGLLVCIGGSWFWFFIRADVVAEGHSPFRIIRADLFILSLLASVTLGLIWGCMQATASSWAIFFFGCYLVATAVLFGSIPWSKFSHMFFKPAAALQKRITEAGGSRNNLPNPVEKPEAFGSTRQLPRHY